MREPLDLNNDDLEEAEPTGSISILDNQTINFNAVIDDSTVDEFLRVLYVVVNNLKKFEIDFPGFKPSLRLLYSTTGGSVYDAFRMYDAIDSASIPVDIYATGLVASSGLTVLLSGRNKYTFPHTSFLYHQISGRLAGNQEQMRGFYQHTEKLAEYVNQLIVENTRLTMDQLRQMATQEHWFDAETAREYGFVDSIVRSFK